MLCVARGLPKCLAGVVEVVSGQGFRCRRVGEFLGMAILATSCLAQFKLGQSCELT